MLPTLSDIRNQIIKAQTQISLCNTRLRAIESGNDNDKSAHMDISNALEKAISDLQSAKNLYAGYIWNKFSTH